MCWMGGGSSSINACELREGSAVGQRSRLIQRSAALLCGNDLDAERPIVSRRFYAAQEAADVEIALAAQFAAHGGIVEQRADRSGRGGVDLDVGDEFAGHGGNVLEGDVSPGHMQEVEHQRAVGLVGACEDGEPGLE